MAIRVFETQIFVGQPEPIGEVFLQEAVEFPLRKAGASAQLVAKSALQTRLPRLPVVVQLLGHGSFPVDLPVRSDRVGQRMPVGRARKQPAARPQGSGNRMPRSTLNARHSRMYASTIDSHLSALREAVRSNTKSQHQTWSLCSAHYLSVSGDRNSRDDPTARDRLSDDFQQACRHGAAQQYQ